MKRLKKIWADPVGSKIISAIIIAIGAILWTFISSKINDTDFQTSFIKFWTLEIQLWWFTIGVLLILTIFWLKRILKKSSFNYDEETLNLDKKIFEKIRNELLPQTGAIGFLRYNNFAGFSFENESIDDLGNFEDECKKSDFEFLNPNLEKMKLELLNSVDHFTSQIAGQTFRTSNGRQTVPPEWETEQPERFWKVVDDLHETKFKICNNYDDLIKSGRRILKI